VKMLAKDNMEQECNIWKEVWGVKQCRVEIMQVYRVLIMPYVKTYAKEEVVGNSEREQAVKLAIDKLANGGYQHKDLRWNHVGFHKSDGKLQSVLFDLSRVDNVRTKEEKQIAASEMTR